LIATTAPMGVGAAEGGTPPTAKMLNGGDADRHRWRHKEYYDAV